MSEQSYAEKRTLVYKEYERCLDLDVSLDMVPLASGERERLEKDEELRALILVCDAKNKSDVVDELRSLRSSENDGVALSALKEWGRIFYAKKFRESSPGDSDRPIHLIYEIVEKVKE